MGRFICSRSVGKQGGNLVTFGCLLLTAAATRASGQASGIFDNRVAKRYLYIFFYYVRQLVIRLHQVIGVSYYVDT